MRVIILLLLGVLIIGCKSSKNLSTVETAPSTFIMPELLSTVNLRYEISKQAIKDTFNTLIDDYLESEMKLVVMGMEVEISKTDPASMEFVGQQVLTTLPLEIGLAKKTFINNINASGALVLTFLTDVNMDNNWHLTTATKLEYHEWLVEPKISMGGFGLPLGKIADTIIEKSKGELEKQIDLSIKEQLTIRDKVIDIMKYVEKPIEVDTLNSSWLKLKPEKVYMSDFENMDDWTLGNITIHGKTKLTSFKDDEGLNAMLPEFKWEKTLDDTSHLNMVLDISYEQVNQFLNDNYKGKSFANDGKEITVNEIHIARKGTSLEATVDVKGSFNGQVILKGKPVFNNDEQSFYAEDVDVSLNTKNLLHKAGVWLLKGKIKNQLKELMYFSIKDNIKTFQKQIDSEVEKYDVKNSMKLKAELNNVNVNKFVLDNDRIHTFITIDMYLNAQVYDMRVFNQ